MSERDRMGAIKILQLLPADGWRVVHASTETGEPFDDRMLCWALVTSPDKETGREIGEVFPWGEQMVVGLQVMRDGEVSAAILDDNFLGYIAPGESATSYADEGREYIEKRRKGR